MPWGPAFWEVSGAYPCARLALPHQIASRQIGQQTQPEDVLKEQRKEHSRLLVSNKDVVWLLVPRREDGDRDNGKVRMGRLLRLHGAFFACIGRGSSAGASVHFESLGPQSVEETGEVEQYSCLSELKSGPVSSGRQRLVRQRSAGKR